MHDMVREIVLLHRAECPQPDMKQHADNVHALFFYRFKQFRREVEPGCRRGGGAVCTGIDRLIAFLIRKLFGYIRRKRHDADTIKYFVEYAVVFEADNAYAAVQHIRDRARKFVRINDFSTGLCFFAGARKALPAFAAGPGHA